MHGKKIKSAKLGGSGDMVPPKKISVSEMPVPAYSSRHFQYINKRKCSSYCSRYFTHILCYREGTVLNKQSVKQ